MQHEHTNSQAEMHSLHIGFCCVCGHQNHLSLNSEVTTISFQLQGTYTNWGGRVCSVWWAFKVGYVPWGATGNWDGKRPLSGCWTLG